MRDNTVKKKSDWATIKGKIDAGAVMDYEQKKKYVRVFIMEGNTMFFENLYSTTHRRVVGQSSTNAADYTDFVDNYKDVPDTTPPTHSVATALPDVKLTGNKLQIHESSRPDTMGKIYTTVWTGRGDDIVGGQIGKGATLMVTSVAEDDYTDAEIEFDPQWGEVWVHEGYFQWNNAGTGDTMCAQVVANANVLQTSVNLDYTMDVNRVKYSAGGPGTGTHGFTTTPILVPNPTDTGHWNYDGTNLLPSMDETGAYDIFDKEINVQDFVHEVPMYGSSSSYIRMQSADSAQLHAGYKLRVRAYNNSDSVWKVWCIITVYREQTVMPPVSQ